MNVKLLSILIVLLSVVVAGCTQTVTPPVENTPFVSIVTMVERTIVGAAVSIPSGLSSSESYWVVLENFQFMPRDLEIHAGDTIEWVNTGEATYNFQLSDLVSARLSPGSRAEYIFREKGSYSFTGRLVDDGEEHDDEEDDDEQEEHAETIYGTVRVN